MPHFPIDNGSEELSDGNPPVKNGRPIGSGRSKLDLDIVRRVAAGGGTQAELAALAGVSLRTVERRLTERKYAEVWEGGKAHLLTSLRSKQVSVAMAGNVQMLRWLGENMLKQAHNHRMVDKQGEDRDLNIASVRAYMQNVPAEETE